VVRHARNTFHGMTSTQLRVSHAWRTLVARRLPCLHAMTGTDMLRCKTTMQSAFPRRGQRLQRAL
jgi:hypothetical protein